VRSDDIESSDEGEDEARQPAMDQQHQQSQSQTAEEGPDYAAEKMRGMQQTGCLSTAKVQ
jgi:hypothetical protein